MPGIEQHADVVDADRRDQLHQAIEGVDELVAERGAEGLRADELDAEPATLIAQDLGDGTQASDVPVEVLLEWPLVGAGGHVGRRSRRAQRARRGGQPGQLAQVGFPLLVVAPGDGQIPERGSHAGLRELLAHGRHAVLVDRLRGRAAIEGETGEPSVARQRDRLGKRQTADAERFGADGGVHQPSPARAAVDGDARLGRILRQRDDAMLVGRGVGAERQLQHARGVVERGLGRLAALDDVQEMGRPRWQR